MINKRTILDELIESETIADKAFSMIEGVHKLRNESTNGRIPKRMGLSLYLEIQGYNVQDIVRGLDTMESKYPIQLLLMGYSIGRGERVGEGRYDSE